MTDASHTARITAWDWFKIVGRGTVVAVDVHTTDHLNVGDAVQFDLAPNARGPEGLIDPAQTYWIRGIEESRCLVDHGPGTKQCTMSRGLVVRPAETR